MTAPARLPEQDLAFEVALCYFTPEELMLKFGLTAAQYAGITSTEKFKKAVSLYRREIDEAGTEFKIKARKFAALVLDDLIEIAVDQDASHADRIAAIKELARLAGYSTPEVAGGNTMQAFQVNIVMGDVK